jgi:hypothetical protein
VFRVAERATFNHPYGASALAMLLALRMTQQNARAQDVRLFDGATGSVLVDPLAADIRRRGGTIERFAGVAEVRAKGRVVSEIVLEDQPASPHHDLDARPDHSHYHSAIAPPKPGRRKRAADYVIAALPPRIVGGLVRGLDREAQAFFTTLGRARTQRTLAYQIYYDRVISPPDRRGLVLAIPGPFSTLIDRHGLWSQEDGAAPGAGSQRPRSVIQLCGEEGDQHGRPDEQLMAEGERIVCQVFPEAAQATIVKRFFHRSGHDEYFLTGPGSDADRRGSLTPIANLFLAGDHTAHAFGVVGMEGAVVSGIEAANRVLRRLGMAERERPIVPMSRPGGLVPLLRACLHAVGAFEALCGYRERIA